MRRLLTAIAALVVLAAPREGGGQAPPGRPAFQHTFTGEPLDVTPQPGETLTPAVERFHQAGENPYRDDLSAREAGAGLYQAQCAICHGPDGSGRMGPNLRDDTWAYEKNRTDKGLFETVYGGAGGLMAGFKGRLSQDDILKVMAYLRGLERKAGGDPAGRPG